MSTLVVDPRGLQASSNTLCAFADQVPSAFIAEHFERTLVVTDHGSVDVQRPYARLDAHALSAAAQATATVRRASVAGIAPHGRGVLLAGGDVLNASFVVDASGHTPALVRRTQATTALQSAFGLVVRGRDAAVPPGTALFMDWRSAGVDDGGPPSFLYALAGHDGRLLLEETTLASTSAVPFELLERRLRARLARRGTVIDEVVDVERVCFPMGGGLPRAGQEVAAFGAAAGLVMPVSGYSIARAFEAAGPLATTIVDGLRAGQVATQIAADVTNKQWPRSTQHLRTLQRFGMSALCSFDAVDANAFFAAFFALPADLWRGFFDGTGSVADAQRTMWQLFRQVPSHVRLRLASGARLQDSFAVVFSMAGQKLASAGGSP